MIEPEPHKVRVGDIVYIKDDDTPNLVLLTTKQFCFVRMISEEFDGDEDYIAFESYYDWSRIRSAKCVPMTVHEDSEKDREMLLQRIRELEERLYHETRRRRELEREKVSF